MSRASVTLRTALPILATLSACAGSAPERARAVAQKPAEERSVGPVRWVYTERSTFSFDSGSARETLPRPEPAIAGGARVILENGIVRSSAPSKEPLSGFASIPARLGGGYLIWSSKNLYHATDPLGSMRLIAPVGAIAAVRPWLKTMIVRGGDGVFEIDVRAKTAQRTSFAGMADGVALDDQRAVRLDRFGRAAATINGGGAWTDALDTFGTMVSSISENAGEITLHSPWYGKGLVLGSTGDLRPPGEHKPTPRLSSPHRSALQSLPSSSRSLPSSLLERAIAAGVILPSGAILAGRDGGLRLFSIESMMPLADADLTGIEDRFSRCFPLAPPPAEAASTSAILACPSEAGAAVMILGDALGEPSLEATFPNAGNFIVGPRGRLAFHGRCGRSPASPLDLGAGRSAPRDDREEDFDPMTGAPRPPPPPPEPTPPELPAQDDARVCVRTGRGSWIERRLQGEPARRLYRWVIGDDGNVTAIVLGKETPADAPSEGEGDGEELRSKRGKRPSAGNDKDKNDKSAADRPTVIGDGVRVVRIDPADKALGGAVFPAPPAPSREGTFDVPEADFWDEGGVLRGWVRLAAPGEDRAPPPAIPVGPASRQLPVSEGKGGRLAGLRVDPSGAIEVLKTPAEWKEVVQGGRFALGVAAPPSGKQGDRWYETTDGGATWAPIEPPPSGSIDATSETPMCSIAGCVVRSGLVRVGWGGGSPNDDNEAGLDAAPPRPKQLRLTCSLAEDRIPWAEVKVVKQVKPAAPAKPPPPVKPVKPPPPSKPAPGAKPPLKPAKPPPPAKPQKPSSPPLPISIRSDSSAGIGAVEEGGWAAEVTPPFQPSAALRKVHVRSKDISSNVGAIAPIVAAGNDPIDLLLFVDRGVLRASAPAFSPFTTRSRVHAAAAGPNGSLAFFDADQGLVTLFKDGAHGQAVRIARVTESPPTRLTLGRSDAGLLIVGYSTQSGEVFAGDLDVTNASVGPLRALGRLDALDVSPAGRCSGGPRFVANVDAAVRVLDLKKQAIVDQAMTLAVLFAAGKGQDGGPKLCVMGVETLLPKGPAVVLSARFDAAPSASVRVGAKASRVTCSLEGPG